MRVCDKKIIHRLAGQKFGKLTVLSESDRKLFPCGRTVRAWNVVCECGTEKVVIQDVLLDGRVVSCGCVMRSVGKRRAKYPGAHKKTLDVWRAMLARCENEKHPMFHHYGGRGITVCESWHSFHAFVGDMGEAPEGMSLGRIDNNRGYEPGNCRCETHTQQMRNTRSTKFLVIDGVSRSMTEWSEISGINPTAIRARLKYGWDVRKAVFEPSMRKKAA